MRIGTKVHHLFPLNCLPPFQLTQKTFRLWKLLLAQYMVLKPVLSLTAVFLYFHGRKFDENSWSFNNTHIYFVCVVNLSVTLAFTTLLYFFVEFRTLLAPFHPVGKFASVKAVVFLSFWQGVLCGFLVHFGFIRGSPQGLWTSEEVSTGLQDFLICVEMLFMCYVHHRVFPETPYVPPTGHSRVEMWAVCHCLSISDVVSDTVHSMTDIAAERDHDVSGENDKII